MRYRSLIGGSMMPLNINASYEATCCPLKRVRRISEHNPPAGFCLFPGLDQLDVLFQERVDEFVQGHAARLGAGG